MLCIQNEGLSLIPEHAKIRTAHGIHLHHILHSAALLVYLQKGRNILLLQILENNLQLVIAKSLADGLLKLLALLFQSLCILLAGASLQNLIHTRIDPCKVDALVLHLQLLDERRINVGIQDEGLQLMVAEHTDVLSLLLLVRHIINCALLLLFFRSLVFFLFLVDNLGFHLVAVLIHCRSLLVRIGLIHLQCLRQSQILAVKILEENVIRHLLAELVILEAAILDERTDIIPVLVIVVLIGLAHSGKLVGNLFRDVIRDFLRKAIVLQCASRNVQRKIRAVNDTL